MQVREHRRDLEVGWLGRLFGNRPEPPALPQEASKYGGVPYLEDREDWPETEDGEPAPFVGQLNFAEIETPEEYPDRGIFGVFRAGPSYRNLFTVRWYPNADPDKAISLDWREWGRSPEVPIELSTTDSYQIPESWSEILPDAIEACYDRDELSEKLMTVVQGVQRNGGNIAVPMWPALRRWGRHKSDEGYDPGNYVLWHPARAHTGSMAVTLTIDRADFRDGHLDRCHVVEWQ